MLGYDTFSLVEQVKALNRKLVAGVLDTEFHVCNADQPWPDDYMTTVRSVASHWST